MSELEEALEHVLDLFSQSCGQYNPETGEVKFDHMCLSSYESAQDFLIKMGKIKENQCLRK